MVDISRRRLCSKFIKSLSLEIPKLREETVLAKGLDSELAIALVTLDSFSDLNGPSLSQASVASSTAKNSGPG